MTHGAVFSGVLHLAVLLLAMFGLPWLWQPVELIEAVPVQIVSAEALAESRNQERPQQPQPEPVIPEAPKAPDLPEPAAEAPPEPAPIPEPEPVVEPEPAPEPETTVAEEPVIAPTPPEPVPEPEPAVPPVAQIAQAEPKPTPPQKPKPPKKKKVDNKPKEPEEQPADPDFASALLNKLKDKKKNNAAAEPQQTQQARATPEDYAGPPLSEGEKDLIRSQVEGNWIVDVGMSGIEEMVVEIVVQMNPDGSVHSADFDPSGNNGNPNWVIYAESCKRAVLKSSPLRMPPEKPYEAWAKMTLVFNARQMLGL